MSFSSMNGIRGARVAGGMLGTNRLARPQPQQSPTDQNYGNPYANQPMGAGSQGSTPSTAADSPVGGMMGSAPIRPFAGARVPAAVQNYEGYQGPTEGSGVAPGMRGPAVPQAAPPPAFDPNDPNNAALVGYMNRG
jgi:hypothetical protein